ncbi:hypothetical protein CAPN006_17850 [Capnocytophaga canimorsus]|uniref:methylation-associated defense system ATP-binding protein MAD8 n=1 Tax=Capnocytophaga canimorsus TaxID=28188 RepID=UPI001AC83D9D|nr:ATP-binding protein [Capnocytophaga canimorsus]GIM57392.1 hypothetical protein CAPN006_17850 [Capnocytophaga canimorsus]
MEVKNISLYYRYIIDLIVELYKLELQDAKPGHCMKITGMGDNEMRMLWESLSEEFDNLDTFIIDENSSETPFISATKLIEFRNQQRKPLLVLIPSNSRTAAEDSYGNATFKEISLEPVETALRNSLLAKLPPLVKSYVEQIFSIVKVNELKQSNVIDYLLAVENDDYELESIGRHLNLLSIFPDTDLLKNEKLFRSRLNLNIESTRSLCLFNKPLYDRVEELKIEKDTLQRGIIELFKKETQITSAFVLVNIVSENYLHLWFNNWKIPNLNFEDIKLRVLEIRSTDFTVDKGKKVLLAKNTANAKVTIRYTTTPEPKNLEQLKHFKVILMSVDGGAGQEINVLRKAPNTAAASHYREAKVELNSNSMEEGSYFFKVIAEDENGNILNSNDDFYDSTIQKNWEEQGKTAEAKAELNYKLTCDSEDFDYFFDENPEKEENTRKDKLNNVLQAFFKFNIENLRNNNPISLPIPSETSNVWLNDTKPKLNSTYHINYSPRHNYQVIISSKLRLIENEFLSNPEVLGHISVSLSNNTTATGLQNCFLEKSPLTDIAPPRLMELRQQVFIAIQNSNDKENGIIETANLYEIKDLIDDYVFEYQKWLDDLYTQLDSASGGEEKDKELRMLFSEVQYLDMVKVKSRLPNGQPVSAILMSPLHPLRLAWFVNLMELFEEWYDKTLNYNGHIKDWSNLENIFLGKLTPQNNPYVIVDPNNFSNFDYLGDLSFGWGIYLNSDLSDRKDTLVPVNHQVKYYFRSLLNISYSNMVNSDMNKSVVVKSIKNFLIQHPYTDKLIINLFNVGDGEIFADAMVQVSKIKEYIDTKFEIRIFVGEDSLIENGLALKELINPESQVTEEAELFSQPSKNRLFPKLRYSINQIDDYLKMPAKYDSHLSFLINPFASDVTLHKPYRDYKVDYLNGLILDNAIEVVEKQNGNNISWYSFIDFGENANKPLNSLYTTFQSFTAGALASHKTDAVPAINLNLIDRDKVLLSHLHEFSDWVITFDKNLGPQVFDMPSDDGKIPFLLDYIPGEEVTGVSSYLTTKPSSEIVGILAPHFQDFGIDVSTEDGQSALQVLLEDLRAISSSLVMQLNTSKNKAFEVIGSAFAKRVLEKKGLLENAFLVPIDLHQNLFDNLDSNSKSRADNLFISIDKETSTIDVSVLEIKCRKSLGIAEREDLKMKMIDQINNTIFALKQHYDPNNFTSEDRLDREIKNKELKSLLSFYIDRAFRYKCISENAYNTYWNFIQNLDKGFRFKFNRVGFIFDFSFHQKHLKETLDDDTVLFTFGEKLIAEILDPDSDLNTRRLEDEEFRQEFENAFDTKNKLDPFIQQFKSKLKTQHDSTFFKVAEEKQSFEDASENNKSEPEKELPTEDVSNKVSNNNDEKQADKPAEEPEDKDVEVNDIDFDVLVGKANISPQFGILGKTIQNKTIAMDLSDTNTISLFGVQGGGKSYTIGTVSEMVLKQFDNINRLPSPLAGVIFHYSESMDYEPEFTSMIYPNDNTSEVEKLKNLYGAEPDSLDKVIILTPFDKVEERREQFPSIEVRPLMFSSQELNVQDWLFLLGAIGNDSSYIKQLKYIMKEHRRNITMSAIRESVENSDLLSNTQKQLAKQKLNFAQEYIDDEVSLSSILEPGKLVIVDLRDEFIVKDEALGLFVIMLNIFSGVKEFKGKHFNKFIVFDEAHKYMDNKDLTGSIVTAIREMRHKGVSIMIASQDPPSLPNEIIELSSMVLLHKFNSPQWLKHIQKSVIQLNGLTPADMSVLKPGEAFLWATKANDHSLTLKPVKISTRPRVTKHGGATKQATGN